jgi:PAS domain-containing protein
MFLGMISIAYAIPWMILAIFIWRLIPPENFRNGVLAIEIILMPFGIMALHCFIKNRTGLDGQPVPVLPSEEPEGMIALDLASSPEELPVPPEKGEEECAALRISLQELREEGAKLNKALEEKGRELENVDSKLKEWMLKCQQIEDERNQVKKNLEDQIVQKETLLLQYQEAITAQHRMLKLQPDGADGAIAERDLMAEVKAASLSPDKPQESPQMDRVSSIAPAQKNHEEEIKKTIIPHAQLYNELFSEDDLQGQLRKYIERAVKLGHRGVLGGHASKLSDFAFDGFTIDLRRLFECFRWEDSGVIFIYSRQQDQLLFVNDEVKNLLGWSAEKVIVDFPSILVQGINYWRKLASSLSINEVRQLEILLKTRAGKNLRSMTVLGIVPSGTFQNLLIGIFASPSSSHLMFQT